MIYKRNANFPYPLLTNDSTSYNNNVFNFDCDLDKNNDNFIFTITCNIGSEYLVNLLKKGIANLFLIVDSSDSNFYQLDFQDNNKIIEIKISVKEINIMKNTNLQLIIKADTDLTFNDNYDLISFYDEYKKDININKGFALGLSNIISFNGSMRKPFELFDKRVDNNLKSDIAIELHDEFITIIYKKEDYEFNDLINARNLNNMYLYLGLYKALLQFIKNHSEDGVLISDITPGENNLDNKLLALMQSKRVEELNEDNIDEVIKMVSDNLIDKYNNAIRGLMNGN